MQNRVVELKTLSVSSMTSLEHFLAGGRLPFAGRTEEVDAILSFQFDGEEGDGLQAGLVVGEAGCGKSRLIEEALPHISPRGGATVHAKLRPEGIASIGALLAPALWGSDSAGRLLKAEPEPTLPSVVAGLKRVASLRRTLLVIEDVHLLGGTAAREFGMLLEQLADEPIRLLCASRHSGPDIRALLLPFLRLELDLNSLSRRGVAALWRELFGTPPADEILDVLMRATLGNPLAVRSAIRGGINSGALLPLEGGDVSISGEAFADVVERSAERMTAGMIAHLNAEEQGALCLLAALGESFSVEGVRLLLGEEGEEMVEKFMKDGILVSAAEAVVPLNGRKSAAPPLAFSHSLLHGPLLERGEIDPNLLVSLLEERVPLYAVTPYDLVAQSPGLHAVDPERAAATIDSLNRIAQYLNETSDWTYALTVHRAAGRLLEGGEWSSAEERLLSEAGLLKYHIRLLRRRSSPDDYIEIVEQYLELSRQLASLGYPEDYLYALTYRQGILFQQKDERHWGVQEMVEEHLKRFPDLRYTIPYIDFIREMNHHAAATLNRERQRRIEVELEDIRRSERYAPEIAAYALKNIGSYLLLSWESEEELERREEVRRELDRLDGGNLVHRPWTLDYLYWTGRIVEMIGREEGLETHYRETSVWLNYMSTVCLRLSARIMLGEGGEEMEKSVASLERSLPREADREALLDRLRIPVSALILCGREEQAARLVADYDIPVETLGLFDRVMMWFKGERPGPLWSEGEEFFSEDEAALCRMVEEADRGGGISPETLDGIVRTTRIRPIKLTDLSAVSAILVVAEWEVRQGRDFPAEFIEDFLRPAVLAGLEWLAERSLVVPLPRFLARGKRFLQPREREGWEKPTGDHPPVQSAAIPERETRLRIGMFGTITCRRRGEEPVRLRGGRNQALLGTLVADLLLREPMERIDFIALATGDESDPDRARRSMNVAVLRLREVLGKEAILTDGETPRLNPEDVSVDLLDAYDFLRLSRKLLRRGELRPAREELAKTLNLWSGRVPFPGLYADLFEELREQFETGLRNTVVSVGEKLLEVEDNEAAEELLGKAFAILPEDEEIGELLKTALVRLGKYADSGWVEMKGSESLESS